MLPKENIIFITVVISVVTLTFSVGVYVGGLEVRIRVLEQKEIPPPEVRQRLDTIEKNQDRILKELRKN